MILQLTYREMECLYEHLRGCITDAPTTADKEKEYFISCHIQQIMKRLYKKMADVFADGCNNVERQKIKLDGPEALSISKYLTRYKLPVFLQNIFDQVNNGLNKNLLDIQTSNKTFEETTSSISEW